MMHIESFWLIGGHKLKLRGIHTGDNWKTPGQASCLLHCETCDKWWPVLKWFDTYLSLTQLKNISNELHRMELPSCMT